MYCSTRKKNQNFIPFSSAFKKSINLNQTNNPIMQINRKNFINHECSCAFSITNVRRYK